MKKNIIIISLMVVTTLLWLSNYYYSEWNLQKISLSSTILTTSYLLFKVFLQKALSVRVIGKKARYNANKFISLSHIFITAIILFRVWVPDTTTLVAVYGFLAAAIAFSIQDVFKNLVGGILIFMKGVYKVGDRVKINDVVGDVVDIDIWYTYVLEIQEWVSGDQATGRVVSVPNEAVITGTIANYTDDHDFIWDEIHIPISYNSDWKRAKTIIQEIMDNHTQDVMKVASKNIEKLEEKYFLTSANIESNVFVKMTDNWISLYGRYITHVRQRRVLGSNINIAILEAFEKENNITVASATMVVTTIKQK